jgi:hypothetical protein
MRLFPAFADWLIRFFFTPSEMTISFIIKRKVATLIDDQIVHRTELDFAWWSTRYALVPTSLQFLLSNSKSGSMRFATSALITIWMRSQKVHLSQKPSMT